jgi:hypothetical protein
MPCPGVDRLQADLIILGDDFVAEVGRNRKLVRVLSQPQCLLELVGYVVNTAGAHM